MTAQSHILAADASQVVQEMIFDGLTEAGYRLTVVATGEEVLEQARSTLPDLILLARVLPDLGGLEVLRELRSDVWTYQIPVIFVTSPHREKYVSEALRAGATDYLLKPFSPGDIQSKVAIILGSSRTTETCPPWIE